MTSKQISLKNVRVHNLKSVSLKLKHNELVVFTGVSGSGKSSLAFDTLYVEGQRRYVESLSTFARRYLGEMTKPDVEEVSGLSPTISVEQKTAGNNPRSTVGTLTELYDYLRVLFARVGVPHCPVSGERVAPQSRERIIKTIQSYPSGSKLVILSPFARGKKAEFREDFQDLLRKGFMRARVDGQMVDLNDDISLDGNLAHDVDVVIDRLKVDEASASRISESITLALDLGDGVCSVLDAESNEETLYSMHAYSPASGLSYSALEPQDFSFNSPAGMCDRCQGLGQIEEFDLELVIDPSLSIAEGCCSIASSYNTVRYGNIYDNLARLYKFDVNTPWEKLPKKAQNVFLNGTQKKWTQMQFVHPTKGTRWTDYVAWRGVLHEAHKRFTEATSETYRKKMRTLMHQEVCPECKGTRLKPYPSATKLAGQTIHALTQMTVAECQHFFAELELEPTEQHIASELLKEIRQRIQFLMDVGLHYLTLDRTAPTLSGGEAQRVRLASQIGCGLVGVTYILDEPSIGLHPRDNKKLIQTLQHLRDRGNTVVVVEHDEETMWAADRIVDFGPGAGHRGGHLLCHGSLKQLLRSKKSVTAAYLRGEKEISVPKKRRKRSAKKQLVLKGANHHNLKNFSAKIPLGLFVAVTGVSGSGKSSFVSDILHPALSNLLHKGEQPVGKHKELKGTELLDKVIGIDQSPIGRNPRSNPATYIKVFDEIRDLFCMLPESQARGYKPGRFSFNVKEGSCGRCSGIGQVQVDMDFMETAWVECPVCHGRRFDQETLSVLYKGKTIYDVLEMEAGEARDFFKHIPAIRNKLDTLVRVGMDYIRLGQPSTTLSGGEAQRIKLAKELSRPSTGNTLYILDEPTTGLHLHDIDHLLRVLHDLVDRGNTVLVIEHQMDVVKTADWIIDLGPEGGEGGGRLVGEGTPEKIARENTPTGEAVREILEHDPKAKASELLAKAEEYQREVAEPITEITVRGAEEHNLKTLNVTIPRNKTTVCTGPSGSGKTSLALDTIYAEGQRRYIESLSPYARQFVKQMPKPKVEEVEGLSPAVAIEQKAHAGNPRSTVGTMTEIYDYFRVLYARAGTPYCPETGERIQAISKDHVVDRILTSQEGQRIHVLAPLTLKKAERFEDLISRFRRQGFLRIHLNGELYRLDTEEEIPFNRRRKNTLHLVVDRLKVDGSMRHRLLEAVDNAAYLGGGKLAILQDETLTSFNLTFSVESTGKSYPELTPRSFAFNTQEGMCQECQGLGTQYGANLLDSPEILTLPFWGLMRLLWGDYETLEVEEMTEAFLEEEGIDGQVPLEDLSAKKVQLIMNGSPESKTYSYNGITFAWPGINTVLARMGRIGTKSIREGVIPLLEEHQCPACNGSRLNPLASAVELEGVPLAELCRWPIGKVHPFIETLPLKAEDSKLLEEVQQQLLSRLSFLNEVGLHYLSLDRRAPTLSGGEAQRIRLARQLGSSLTGVLYVLDEPTIGLHPRDNARLSAALKKLKDLGNTILMVEHDPQTVRQADYVLDFGPQSGMHGGHITAEGTVKQIEKNEQSLTGQYLSGRKQIRFPSQRRPICNEGLKVSNARVNNLKQISLTVPIGALTCLTGVSGSGKSTLMHQVILPAVRRGLESEDRVELEGGTVSGIDNFDRLIVIDQNPIGQTVRSNVATYVDLLTPLRQWFAALPDAQAKGLLPRHFSYNHRRGMCTNCWGLGYKRIQMHFLPSIRVTCDQCHGLRLNPVSLEVRYKGRNLGEYLKMTVDEVLPVFESMPRLKKLLLTLQAVGLGYLQLGQEMQTLSGGEAQRLKLSRELVKRSTGSTLYLLDEPTTGLHPDDIDKLLQVMHKLVDKGNTMLVIEHNLDLIRSADHVIELGPDAGEAGGEVICTGSIYDLMEDPKSVTGPYLINEKSRI